jgi:hypothetical protein
MDDRRAQQRVVVGDQDGEFAHGVNCNAVAG